MKNKASSVFLILFAALVGAVCAASERAAVWETPPGWTETRGGAGGKIFRVTTLAASGRGSLAEALAKDEPRVIEFSVGGIINLKDNSLRVTKPYLTIAGETAPNPGITITNGDMSIGTHDVIVRHIRIAAGAGAHAKNSGWEVDGLTTGRGAHDVIVDHCSFLWATDENLTASGPQFRGENPDEWRENTSHRITFSHCIIGEGLNASSHSKGPHSKGTLLHDNTGEIAIVGNLYVSNADRNPIFKAGVRAAVVNNVIYNPGERVMQFGYVSSQWRGRELQRADLTMVGNVVRKGPSSAAEMAFFEVWPENGLCDFHLSDNLFFDAAGRPLPVTLGARDRSSFRPGFDHVLPGGSGYEFPLAAYHASAGMRQVQAAPVWPPRLKALPASETQAWVLANVGARPWDRAAVDQRLVDEVLHGGGKIIDHEPSINAKSPPTFP